MTIAKERQTSIDLPLVEDGQIKIDPLVDGISSVELVRVSGSDVDIVNAARVSFGKTITELSVKDEKLIRYLLKHKHTSPFEHNQLSFRIKAPIYVVRQWMRHRMSSYNEISYRYVKSALEFYIPNDWRYQDEDNRQASYGAFKDSANLDKYEKSLTEAAKGYNDLLEAGVCREQARGLLPMCTYTEFIYTCNLHSFMHFLGLRTGKGAQLEIKVYAEAMLKLAEPHFKIALKAWRDFYIDKE
jgi:thymidylate synthase (FAD)